MTPDTRAPTAEDSLALLEPLTGYTPGRWKWWTSNSWRRLKHADLMLPVMEPFVASDGHPDCCVSSENMAIIAAAPDLVDHLRAALDREDVLKAERDAARAEVENARGALRRMMVAVHEVCDPRQEADPWIMGAMEEARSVLPPPMGQGPLPAGVSAADAEITRLRARVEAAEKMADALRALTGEDVFLDREYLSQSLNGALDEACSALAVWDASREGEA